MVDETSDVSNTEQLLLCLRWVDDELIAHEEFNYTHIRGQQCRYHRQGHQRHIATHEHIVVKVRSQCYDGCSTMKGQKSGVAK